MKTRFKKQARQFYEALKARGQTWTRNRETLEEWAESFEQLESDIGNKKRIRRALNWYCETGIGALYVPLVCTADKFFFRFRDIEQARINSETQQIRYFDDVLKYRIKNTSGSKSQQAFQRVTQKIAQQVKFVDDLKHKRVRLPKLKKVRSVETESLTKNEREQLSGLLIINRELLLRRESWAAI